VHADLRNLPRLEIFRAGTSWIADTIPEALDERAVTDLVAYGEGKAAIHLWRILSGEPLQRAFHFDGSSWSPADPDWAGAEGVVRSLFATPQGTLRRTVTTTSGSGPSLESIEEWTGTDWIPVRGPVAVGTGFSGFSAVADGPRGSTAVILTRTGLLERRLTDGVQMFEADFRDFASVSDVVYDPGQRIVAAVVEGAEGGHQAVRVVRFEPDGARLTLGTEAIRWQPASGPKLTFDGDALLVGWSDSSPPMGFGESTECELKFRRIEL
jgi:hypothetical protein